MSDPVGRQLDRLLRREDRYLLQARRAFVKTKLIGVTSLLEEKIPPELQATLEKAFYKGFQLVFEKGTGLIEKSYDKDRLRLEHAVSDRMIEERPNAKTVDAPARRAAQGRAARVAVSTAEGGLLGLLGVGIPDIPLFIGVLLSGIYEIALTYGFDYSDPGERYYILKLIETSLAGGETIAKANRKLDVLGRELALGEVKLSSDAEDRAMSQAAMALAEDMIYQKFIQGLPVVGVVGGVFNFTYCRKITAYADLKYQKRYLLSKLKSTKGKAINR